MVKKEEYHMLQYSRSGAGLLNHLPFETNRWTRSTTIRALCLSIYRLACFLQNQRAIAVFGLSSTTTNLCCSATSPHLTHLWYIVNHYHPRIFDPMICLSSSMSRYFLSILNGNHVIWHPPKGGGLSYFKYIVHTVSYYVNYTPIEMGGFSSRQKSRKSSGRVHTTP